MLEEKVRTRSRWREGAVGSAVMYRGSTVLAAGYFAVQYSPDLFAPVAILTVYTPMVTLVASLGLDQAYFRELIRAKSVVSVQGDVLRLFIAPLLMLPVFLGISLGVAEILNVSTRLLVCASLSGVVIAASQLPLSAYLRSRNLTTAYVGVFATTSVLGITVRVFAEVLGVSAGWAWISGDIAIGLLCLVFTAVWWWKSSSPGVNSEFRGLVRYGLPITLHGVFQWVLGSSDRFIFAAMLPSASVGMYGAIYQFAGLFGAAASEVNKSGMHRYPLCSPGQVSRIMKRDRRVFGGIWLLGFPVVTIALAVLQSRGYQGGIPLGLSLYASFLPLVFYLPLANSISLVSGNSRWMGFSSLGGAVVNVGLVIALVPSTELYSGAIANAVGYTSMALILYILRSKGSRN